MKVFCVAFIFLGLNVVISGFFTALELPGRAGAISLLRGGVLAMVLLAIFPAIFGASGIWYVAPASEIAVFVISASLVWKKLNDWKSGNSLAAAPA